MYIYIYIYIYRLDSISKQKVQKFSNFNIESHGYQNIPFNAAISGNPENGLPLHSTFIKPVNPIFFILTQLKVSSSSFLI